MDIGNLAATLGMIGMLLIIFAGAYLGQSCIYNPDHKQQKHYVVMFIISVGIILLIVPPIIVLFYLEFTTSHPSPPMCLWNIF